MNSWSPGQQSTVFPNAPRAALPGRSRRSGWHRAGVLEGPDAAHRPGVGSHRLAVRPSIRAAYGIFYDSFTNGVGGPLQAPLSALPWTQARQLSPPINFTDPWNGQNPFTPNSFPQPTTVLTVENGMRPPYAQNWNFSVQRSLAATILLDVRYIGNKGTRLPRMIEGQSGGLWAGRHVGQCRPAPALRRLPRAAGPLRLRVGRTDHRLHQFHLSRGAGRAVAPLLERPRVSGLVHVFEVARLRLELQRGGLGAAAGGRRKRPGAESVRPERGARAVAVRRAPPVRVERQLRDSVRRTGRLRAPLSPAGS